MSSGLEVHAKKIELIQWLSTIDDVILLDKIAQLISHEQKNDWWDGVSEAEKASIEKGKQDVEEGKLTNHRQVRSLYAKWL